MLAFNGITEDILEQSNSEERVVGPIRYPACFFYSRGPSGKSCYYVGQLFLIINSIIIINTIIINNTINNTAPPRLGALQAGPT